ncbi:hypothetical protein PML78_12475 [Enterococcus dispar]|uniref:hypothetical protein n=1 Tax=Enterococcus dispar TaxID=44009 RepID=UPI002330FA34|nr:hypothetical protein [Enterococcus dispar]WCG32989.1 hypothetical protein PML78_12475 [Enterococcus dispar]
MTDAEYEELFVKYCLGIGTKKEKAILATQEERVGTQKNIIPKQVGDFLPISISNSEYTRLKDIERKYNELIG